MDLHHLQRQPSDASSYQLYGARRLNTHETHDRNVSLDVSHTYDYNNTHKHQSTEILEGDLSVPDRKESNHAHNLTINQLYQPQTSMDGSAIRHASPERPRAKSEHHNKKKPKAEQKQLRPATARMFDTEHSNENKSKKRSTPKIIRRAKQQREASKSQELDASLCSYVGLGLSQKSNRHFLPRQISAEQTNQSYIPCIATQKSETMEPFFLRNKSIEMQKISSFPSNYSPQKKAPKKYKHRTNIRLSTPVRATHSKSSKNWILETQRSNASTNTARSGHSNQQWLTRSSTHYHGTAPGQLGISVTHHRRHRSVPGSATSSGSTTNGGSHSRSASSTSTSGSWTSATSMDSSSPASSDIANELNLRLQCDDDAHSGKDEVVEVQIIDEEDVDKENLNVQNSLTLQEDRKFTRRRLNDKRRKTVTEMETPGSGKTEISKTNTCNTTTFVVHNDDSCLTNVYDEYEDEETESYDVDKIHSNMIEKTLTCDQIASYQLEGI